MTTKLFFLKADTIRWLLCPWVFADWILFTHPSLQERFWGFLYENGHDH